MIGDHHPPLRVQLLRAGGVGREAASACCELQARCCAASRSRPRSAPPAGPHPPTHRQLLHAVGPLQRRVRHRHKACTRAAAAAAAAAAVAPRRAAREAQLGGKGQRSAGAHKGGGAGVAGGVRGVAGEERVPASASRARAVAGGYRGWRSAPTKMPAALSRVRRDSRAAVRRPRWRRERATCGRPVAAPGRASRSPALCQRQLPVNAAFDLGLLQAHNVCGRRGGGQRVGGFSAGQ